MIKLNKNGKLKVSDYFSGLSAYRRLNIRTVGILKSRYGDYSLKSYFGVMDLSELSDANNSRFLTRGLLSAFLRESDKQNYVRTLNWFDSEFNKDAQISNLKRSLNSVGQSTIAEDLLHFFEHRLAVGRKYSQKRTNSVKAMNQEAENVIAIYA